ncbi:MAG TPA: hypothetical protein DD490_20390 [Acidobacteria bacterium]|nr:hypothetical protein [Acidobacteriota bacterium]
MCEPPSSPRATLLFTITPGDDTWTIVGPTPGSPPHVVDNPLGDAGFLRQVGDLRRYANLKLPPERKREIGQFEDVARELSPRITGLLLSEEARRAVRIRLNQVQLGRATLTIRLADHGAFGDQVLALPWELVAPEPPELPVRQSRLEVVREVVVPEAPELPAPGGLAVAVAVAAPEGQVALSYEKEEVRLQTALGALGPTVAFSDLGTLDDLVDLVAAHRATAILFSGHGLPGHLLFEDRLGFADRVAMAEVVRRLRTVLLSPGRQGTFPGLFFLSSCDGASGAPGGGGSSAAAALHRAGFAQVIGYFGAVRDSAAGRAEETYFRSLARGETALQAAHLARASLVDVIVHEGEPFVFPLAWTQLAIYHRGADRPAVETERKGRPLPPRFRRRCEVRGGVPVLTQGFVGRRALQHEILRKVHQTGERLIVLQGLGGSGKTALAGHLMTRRLAPSPDPAGVVFLRVSPPGEDPDPILALRREAEEHGRRYGLPGWDDRVEQLRAEVPASAAGFAATLRALQDACPDLAVCLDRVDALQVGPGALGGPGAWWPGAEEWWREVEGLAADGMLILATTRYAGADLPVRSYVGMPPLSAADAFRMMSFFAELGELTPAERRRLAEWSEGHPLTLEWLDRAVEAERRRLGLGFESIEPWEERVAPVLPGVTEETRRALRLDELWDGLPESAREQARRIAEAMEPLSSAEILALGGERDRLIRCGLLVRNLREERADDGTFHWIERWGLPRLLGETITGEGG